MGKGKEKAVELQVMGGARKERRSDEKALQLRTSKSFMGPDRDDSESDESGGGVVTKGWRSWLHRFRREANEYSFAVLGIGDHMGKSIWTTPLPRALLILQVVEVLVCVAFLWTPDTRSNSKPQFDSDRAKTVMDAQLVALGVALVSGIYTTFYTIGTYLRDNLSRLHGTVWHKVVVISLCDITLLAYPTSGRLAFVSVLIIIHVVESIIVLWLDWMVQATEPGKKITDVPLILRSIIRMRGTVGGRSTRFTPITVHMVERLLHWLSPRGSASATMGFTSRGRNEMLSLSLVVVLFCAANFVEDFHNSITTDSPLLDSRDLTWIGDNVPAGNWPLVNGTQAGLQGGSRVVLVLVDGLNYKHMFINQHMQDAMAAHEGDMALHELEAELPSTNMPNWFCSVGGTLPETTGQRGNTPVGDGNGVDTVFHRSKEAGLVTGAATVPWMLFLFRHEVDRVEGDGSRTMPLLDDPSLVDDVRDHDDARHADLLTALRSSSYDFLLGHYLELSKVGGDYGCDSKEYNDAVSRAANRVQDVVNAVDDDTVVLVTSSHGITRGGGYGGEGTLARQIPLLVFKRNSGINDSFVEEVFGEEDVARSLTWVAPSISALLGTPVPHHNQGLFIDSLLSLVPAPSRALLLENLFLQWRTMTERFLRVSGYKNVVSEEQVLYDAQYVDDTPGMTHAKATRELQQIYAKYRGRFRRWITWRNEASAFVILILLLMFFVYAMQTKTVADPLCVVYYRVHSHWLLWWESPDFVAFRVALRHVALYYAANFAAVGVALMVADLEFSFSSMQTFRNRVLVLCCVLLPGPFVTVAVTRVVYVTLSEQNKVLLEMRRSSPITGTIATVSHWLTGQLVFADSGLIYLARLYALMVSILCTFTVLLVASAHYTYVIPLVFRLPFLEEGIWRRRFQILMTLGMSVPLVTHMMYLVYKWRLEAVDTTVLSDLNRLRLGKARRYKQNLSIDFEELHKDEEELHKVEAEHGDDDLISRYSHLGRGRMRLSDWCVDVSSSVKLTDIEKRKLLHGRMLELRKQVRNKTEERLLTLQQKESMEARYAELELHNARVLADLKQAKDGFKGIKQEALAEVKGRMEERLKGKKVPEKAKRQKVQEEMRQRLREKMEERKAKRREVIKDRIRNRLAMKQAQELAKMPESIKEDNLQLLNATMELHNQLEEAERGRDEMRDRLDQIAAKMEEQRRIHARQEELIVGDTRSHKDIGITIVEEIDKEQEFQQQINDAIDATLESISDKQRKLDARKKEFLQFQEQAEKKKARLKHRVTLAKEQQDQMMEEMRTIQKKLARVKTEYDDNLKWAEKYERTLMRIKDEMDSESLI